jgi:hypothetical protein
MRENDPIPLALQFLQLFGEISARPPNRFGAEIYPRTYRRLMWRFSGNLQMRCSHGAVSPCFLATMRSVSAERGGYNDSALRIAPIGASRSNQIENESAP